VRTGDMNVQVLTGVRRHNIVHGCCTNVFRRVKVVEEAGVNEGFYILPTQSSRRA